MSTQLPLFDSPIIKIAHLSDLHFAVGKDDSSTQRHSVDLLRETERVLEEVKPDYVVVTGDLTNHGDFDSLTRVRDWLLGTISIGGARTSGLRLNEKGIPLAVVPGNHDAWNDARSAPYRVGWQRALKNFSNVFPSLVVDRQSEDDVTTEEAQRASEDNDGVPTPEFDWWERGQHGVFLAFLTTCDCGPVPSADRIAVGKLAVEQSEALFQLFNSGMKGRLISPRSGTPISATAFASSLKLAVMHHYIFEPSKAKVEPLLRLRDKERVLRNLMLAQFDAVLCGHKHFSEGAVHSFGHHLSDRARARYLFNCYRLALRIDALPMQYRDENSKKVGRLVSFLVNYVWRTDPGASVDDLIETLREAARKPSILESRMQQSLFDDDDGQPKAVELQRKELREVTMRLKSELSKGEREALTRWARAELLRAYKALGKRPFVQFMAGSTTKVGATEKRRRGLNVYQVGREADAFVISTSEYRSTLEQDTGKVSFTPHESTPIPFSDYRTPQTRL